jgi:hypothetical protein
MCLCVSALKAAAYFQRLFSGHNVKKTYLARVRGKFPVCPVTLDEKDMAVSAGRHLREPPAALLVAQSNIPSLLAAQLNTPGGASGLPELQPAVFDQSFNPEWVFYDGEAWLKLQVITLINPSSIYLSAATHLRLPNHHKAAKLCGPALSYGGATTKRAGDGSVRACAAVL